MDTLSPEQRSRTMSRIKGKDTAPERAVRSLLHRMGYRFRLHRKTLPGTPDIVLPRHRAVIFVHGCFWHGHPGCGRATLPATRREFWSRKIADTRERDRRAVSDLEKLGYRCCIVWQCELKDTDALGRRLAEFLGAEQDMSPAGDVFQEPTPQGEKVRHAIR